ncbi:hypothetical protein [Alkaliphilus transvaalensis]|uniref:hypothetical protein n=1 Tax=Alkaliphilus transvaalensis TaxID=114628 RepID=UPI0004791983|nr:hypothetical protein [Alkaliphilus transvaalensis]
MDALIIEPKQGIGTISLGMSPSEVEQCIKDYSNKYLELGFDQKFFKHVFQIDYSSENKVNFIQIISDIKNIFNCVFKDIDIFNTKAEILIKQIEQISPYDSNHWELGYTYAFPKLGLYLWRPSIFKEADKNEDWYKALSLENQEEELKYLYFQTVSIESNDYRNL